MAIPERKLTLLAFRPLKLDTHKYAASVCKALGPRDLGVTKFFMKHGLRHKIGRNLVASIRCFGLTSFANEFRLRLGAISSHLLPCVEAGDFGEPVDALNRDQNDLWQ